MLRVFAKLLLLILPLAACAQSNSPPEQGSDYDVLENGQRWQSTKGKMEVVELFSYSCGHCADFQPMIDAWKKTMPKDVSFAYVPATYDLDNAYARAYFAAEMAGALPKVHSQLFIAIHKEGSVPKHNATIEELGTFFAGRGLNRNRMIALMRSKEVTAKMQRARDYAIANKLGRTPTLVLDGRYVVSGRSLPDHLRILDALIAQQRVPKAASKTN